MSVSAVAETAGARCKAHPDATATGTCDRCGAYFCAACSRAIDAKRFCTTCLDRPGVDYLAEFKQKMWGKRDGWVWWLGIAGSLGALSLVVFGVSNYLTSGDATTLLLSVDGAYGLVVFPLYFFRKRWTRVGIFGFAALNLIANLAIDPTGAAPSFGRQVLPFIFYLSAFNSTRNKLAFELDVPDTAVQKLYKAYYDNQLGRAGMLLGILAFLMPPLAVVSLPLSIAGYNRARDPNRWPPVGRRKSSLAGIICSSLAILEGLAIVVGMVVSK